MKRLLITGAGGFVAPLLASAVREQYGRQTEIVGASRDGEAPSIFDRVIQLDLTDSADIDASIATERPDAIAHLAGISAPREASSDPRAAWRVNVDGTLFLARATLAHVPHARFMFAGSGTVYGETAQISSPLDENATLRPTDEYSATKAAADLALGAMAHQGLNVVRMRPFNHTGPGQSLVFVAPAFAMQIARIEAELAAPIITVGNLEAERDFLDARDVARAYALALNPAARLERGEILNVCSGTSLPVGMILDRLKALSRSDVRIEIDPARLRPGDPKRVVGDPSRIQSKLGWSPIYDFNLTLEALLEDCRRSIADEMLSYTNKV